MYTHFYYTDFFLLPVDNRSILQRRYQFPTIMPVIPPRDDDLGRAVHGMGTTMRFVWATTLVMMFGFTFIVTYFYMRKKWSLRLSEVFTL